MIRFETGATSAEALRKVIHDTGFTTEAVDPSKLAIKPGKSSTWAAPLPESGPAFFREQFLAARKQGKPIIVDFWATWCGPCVQLKKVTFGDDAVKELLAQCEVIFVDVDEYEKLGSVYGVSAVPDVFLIDRNGQVLDRLQNFEPPKEFAVRLKAFLDADGTDSADEGT